jgi:methylmalonyl-CoA mutase
MNKPLFTDFEQVSEKEWKQKIQVDLKGKDYNEVMLTHTDEGIDIKPFYHQDSKENIKIPSPKQWYITEDINHEELNALKDFKSKGAEAFFIESIELKDAIHFPKDIESPVFLMLNTFDKNDLAFRENLVYTFDPINRFIKSGNWIKNQSSDLENHKKFVESTDTLSIDARIYHNSGANITQQLAYTIAQLQFYINASVDDQKPLNIYIFCAIGTNYFFEIAKLKALRLLVNSVCKAHNIKYNLKLVSEPGTHHMSIYDYNVNMLRSTTECMSAILGGSDFVKNTYYDVIFKNRNEFSRRVARNQLLILKHESYFDKVENVADGSYYISYLIKALAEKSLNIFKGIEKSGGLIQQLFDGKIQEKINQQLNKTIQQFEAKELKLIGVNVYPNEEEKISSQIDKDIFSQPVKRKTLIKPITPKRIAEMLEQQRLKEESN